MPLRLQSLLEMCQVQANMAEINKTVERDNNSRRDRETPRVYTQECSYLGIRNDGKAFNRGHALMHMLTWKYIIISSTHESSIKRRNTAKIIDTDKIWIDKS